MLQLVLGMAGGAWFEELFAKGNWSRGRVNRSAIGTTSIRGHFGRQDAIGNTVKALVGHSAKFDYQGLGEIPKNKLTGTHQLLWRARSEGIIRKPMWKDDCLSFVTPDAWLASNRGVGRKYEALCSHVPQRGKPCDWSGTPRDRPSHPPSATTGVG